MAQPDLTQLSGEMYKQWEKAASDWWDKVLESPSFLGAMGDQVAAQSRLRKGYEERVDESMAAMHLPSRKDVVRLARVATLLEGKLLSLEDRLLSLDDRLSAMDARMDGIERETLRARVDAAEARLAVAERLTSLEDKIDALTAALDGSRARKGRANAGE